VLFIDEAAQMAQACLRYHTPQPVVLLGDPQQLEQLQYRAATRRHRRFGAAHILGEEQTIAACLFLADMAPSPGYLRL
jgi:hypothetical protein